MSVYAIQVQKLNGMVYRSNPGPIEDAFRFIRGSPDRKVNR